MKNVGLNVKGGSKIHGIGVFAMKNVPKGEVFYEVPTDRIYNFPQKNCAQIGKEKWVSDEFILRYVNHSCNPNAVFDISGKPKLVAKEDIAEGEEITADYDLTEVKGLEVPCSCGDSDCRGKFLSTDAKLRNR